MKSIIWLAILSAMLTSCIATSPPTSTLIPTPTFAKSLANEQITSTPRPLVTVTKIVSTQTPTETPTQVQPTPTEVQPTPTEPEPTPTPEPIVVENLNHIPEGSIGCINPELCYHMTVSPENGKKGMDEAKTAFAKSPMLQKFWKEVGVKVPISPETLDEWLEQSVGGPENKSHWVPAESPNGTPFMYLQGEGGGHEDGEFAEGTLVNKNGGFYLDKMAFLAFSYTDWRQDERLRDFFSKILEENWRHSGPLIVSGGLKNSIILRGLIIRNNRFIFTVGHQRPLELKALWQERRELGGVNQEFRPDFDTMIMQAQFSTYFGYTSEWRQSKRDWSYKNRNFCILSVPGCKALINVMSVKESIFEPAE